MKEKIWLSSPHMGGNEFNYIKEAYDTNWIAPLGPNVNGLEKAIEEYTNCGYAAALNTGTAAIHLALIISGVVKDDEVLCSSFTFSASANPIVYQGAIPIFIDSEEDTWNIDPVLLREAIVDRVAKGKKPKALILVHLYGMPSKMDEIVSICKEYEIVLIEDAAEALGSTYNGKALGTFGEFGILSFNGNKIITTSGGGALMSSNKEAIEKARFLSTQARDEALHYQHSQIGYNYRMSNISAGIGRGQFEVLNDRVNKKREIFEYYKKTLSSLPQIQFLEEMKGFYSNRWLSAILVNSDTITSEDICLALEKENIESRPLWKPMHLQPVFIKYPSYINGISENLFKKGLCLPSDSKLNENDLMRIVDVIKNLF